jgi:hypothetical protein
LSAASELGLHIVHHAGDVIREQNNVFGGAVTSWRGSVRRRRRGRSWCRTWCTAWRGRRRVVFEDRGEREMKDVGEPVRVYAVRGYGV